MTNAINTESLDTVWSGMMTRGQALLRDLSPTMVKALSDLSADRDSTWVKQVTWDALERRGLILSPEHPWKGLTEDGNLVITRLIVLERQAAEADLAQWEAQDGERKQAAQRAADAHYAVATSSDPETSWHLSATYVASKAALISAICDAYGASSGTAEEIYRLMNDGDFIVADAVELWDAEREARAAEDQQAVWEAITAGERGDAEKCFDVDNAAAEAASVRSEEEAELAAMDAAANRAEMLLDQYRATAYGSMSAMEIARQLDEAVEAAYPDIDVDVLVAFLASHGGYTVKLAVASLRQADGKVLTPQQRKIRYHARKLIEAFGGVPDTTIHYAVEQARNIVATLVTVAGDIKTMDVQR